MKTLALFMLILAVTNATTSTSTYNLGAGIGNFYVGLSRGFHLGSKLFNTSCDTAAYSTKAAIITPFDVSQYSN